MKKIVLAALVAAPLCACDKAPVNDYETVAAAVAGGEAVVENVVSVPATDAMLAIYAHEKDSSFANINGDVVRQVYVAGNCLVETVSDTEYRVFCGTAEEVEAYDFKTVSVVKPVAEEAVAEEAPAVEEPAPVAEEAAAPAEAEAPVAE